MNETPPITSSSLWPERFVPGVELGRGASATVFEAHDQVLQRTVAVKVLEGPAGARFLAEAQITSQLEHPYIVPIHDVGQLADGRAYIVMKRVRGQTLRAAMEQGRTGPLLRRLRTIQQVAEAVAFAHQRGVSHRDLKPENVMVDEHGQALVMDWGLVRAEAQGVGVVSVTSRAQTMHCSLLGTLGYMPPESYSQAGRGAAGDVFALGVMLWEMLHGHWPWRGESLGELAFEASRGTPAASAITNDPDLAAIIDRCLAADPTCRFKDARGLVGALRLVTEGTARRARAAEHLERASVHEHELLSLESQVDDLRARVKRLEDDLPRWQPLEARMPLHDARRELEEIDVRIAEAFGALIGSAERALSHDPDSHGAKSLLERAWWRRFEQAEAKRDRMGMTHTRQRLLAYGGERALARLEQPGALTLRTEPAGAAVWSQRVDTSGLMWALGERTLLGRTPIEAQKLLQGSYQLTIRSPGRRDTPYPVLIERGAHHDIIDVIPLLTEEEIGGSAWVYVPAGWTWLGGDVEVRTQEPHRRVWLEGVILQRQPTTMQQYLAFISALHDQDAAEARLRVPRREEGKAASGLPYLVLTPQGWALPVHDADGDEWSLRQPVHSISYDDAVAYCTWVGDSRGRNVTLPSSRLWERAARGADMRPFTWGSRFDPALAVMGQTFEKLRIPTVDFTNGDVAWCGARHLSGLVREWTQSHGDTALVKGGAWNGTSKLCRAANQFPRKPWSTRPFIGFRPSIALEIPCKPYLSAT